MHRTYTESEDASAWGQAVITELRPAFWVAGWQISLVPWEPSALPRSRLHSNWLSKVLSQQGMLPGAADDRNGSHSQHLPFRNVNAEIADEAQQSQTTPLSFFNKVCMQSPGWLWLRRDLQTMGIHFLSPEYNKSHSLINDLGYLEVSFTFLAKNTHGRSTSHNANVQREFECETHFLPANLYSTGDSGSRSLSPLTCKIRVQRACPVWLLSMKSSVNSEVLHKQKVFLLHTEQNNTCCNAVLFKINLTRSSNERRHRHYGKMWYAGLIKISTMPSTPISLES